MKTMHSKNVIVFSAIILITFSNSIKAVGQSGDTITDFYEYANKDWIESTVIPQYGSVVNNWGILWDKIMDESIEILSGDSIYNLDENHQYVLNQLQNFYKSTIEYSYDDRKRAELVQKYYPMLFGILFSNITVSHRKEEKIREIINYQLISYRIKIENSTNVGKKDKELFLSKLANMKFVIGSPSLYSFLKMPMLTPNSLDKNIQLSNEYQLKRKHVYDWNIPPHETNCFYVFGDNKVKIYAGLLFDYSFTQEDDFTTLFATIGRTIAHEMTHAFYPTGKKFKNSDQKITYQSLIKQFNQYSVQDRFFVDGKKTLEENFADLGGVEISLLALKLYMKDKCASYAEEEKLKLIRKFFIEYAHLWREKATPEFERSTLTRAHTPQKFRAIGPIYNQDEFYKVYKINGKSEFYIPENLRIRIW